MFLSLAADKRLLSGTASWEPSIPTNLKAPCRALSTLSCDTASEARRAKGTLDLTSTKPVSSHPGRCALQFQLLSDRSDQTSPWLETLEGANFDVLPQGHFQTFPVQISLGPLLPPKGVCQRRPHSHGATVLCLKVPAPSQVQTTA